MSEMKQVIVIRSDLDMGGGKAVAQGAHASMGAYFDSLDRWGEFADDKIAPWTEDGRRKICLCVDSEQELLALVAACEEQNIGHYLVCDRGLTQVAPNTPTALGIGPDSSRHIDKLTRPLSLY